MSQNKVIDKKLLVTACQAGDREAQGLLYTTYRRKMMKIIRQYVADYNMAQDIMHDGFLIILSQIHSLRNPESLDYWMATIMKNLAIHTISQIEFTDILKEQEDEGDEDIDSNLSYDELMALIQQLPNGYQTVFRLAVLEGKSHKEIADMLGISAKTSASQLARAKEKLRVLIIEHRKAAGLLALLFLVIGITHISKNQITEDSNNRITENSKDRRIEQPNNRTTEQLNNQTTYIAQNLPNPHNEAPMIATDTLHTESETLANDEKAHETADIATHPNDTIKDTQPVEQAEHILTSDRGAGPMARPHRNTWNVNFSSNALGFEFGSNNSVGNGMMADQDPNYNGGHTDTEKQTTSVHHLMPITLGVRFSKDVSERWTMETGVQYSLLRTSITKTNGSWSNTEDIKAHFLSLPIAAKYRFLQWKKANAYALGGMSIDIPVGASTSEETTAEHSKLRYPLSFSVDTGIGFDYQISPTTSLFIQPSLNYHIMRKSEQPILWQDNPLSFDLPIGIRILIK